MTFCLGMKVKDGLVAIADTRVTTGSDTHMIVEHRYGKDDLAHVSNWWQERLRHSVRDLPLDWIAPLQQKLAKPSILKLPAQGTDRSSG